MVEDSSGDSLVSVILPFHNAPTLQKAAESILDQSYQNFELLLIDNASTDGSQAVSLELSHRHDKVQLIDEPKKGVVHAANSGILHSQGAYIMRMDADDYSFPQRMELQVKALQEYPDVGVVSGGVIYKGDHSNVGFIEYVDWLNTIHTSSDIALNQFIELPMANPSMMFRREIFEKYGLFKDGEFPEDYEYFLRLQSNNVKMIKVENQVLRWIDSDNRLTRTDPRYSTDAFFKIKSHYLAEWLKKNNPFHPEIFVWGAGRLSRRRSDYLKNYGIEIKKYIDVKPRENSIHFEEIESPNEAFIVSYVGNRGARSQIRSFLNDRQFIEGVHYILAS